MIVFPGRINVTLKVVLDKILLFQTPSGPSLPVVGPSGPLTSSCVPAARVTVHAPTYLTRKHVRGDPLSVTKFLTSSVEWFEERILYCQQQTSEETYVVIYQIQDLVFAY